MQTLQAISCFTGSGQLERGAERALRRFGYQLRPVAYIEQDWFAQEAIRARVRDGLIPDGPIWPDVRTFPGRRYRGFVDAVVGGFPCQDISVAGRRAGLGRRDAESQTRSGLFFDLLRIAVECDAPLLVLENVDAIVSTPTNWPVPDGDDAHGAVAAVVSEALAGAGFDAIWRDLSAEDVGAPHGRPRWWCIAWRALAHSIRAGKP